jgi:hypothetical protein
MASETPINHELKLARDFVQYTGRHIFLTGKAGTGKTTFLHHLKGDTAKRMIVTAPTGVAAINAGGVTLHSFFQLPFGPFLPGSEAHEQNRQRMFRFSKDKKRIIKSLDLLVIDEISMVRADLLDAVDAVLRQHRRNEQPFGGVQLLMIGDLHQLSPVAKQHEWQLLREQYESVYFFSSHALSRTQMLTIELKHIYRQSDTRFIKLLNQIRDNRLDKSAMGELNRRYSKDYTPEEGEITLTTHNRNADVINETRLGALETKAHRFNAEISGDFPEHAHPAPGALVLKKDAQVMFLRNDNSGEKRYFNGKIGKIVRISSEDIRIKCPGEPDLIAVEPVAWENIKYTVNEESREIEEEIVGKFTQFPLKPAWAITIHKSQGLTFDKAVIDAQAAFAHGQFYVALSRCRTLEGMVLRSPVPSRGIGTDAAVLSFVENAGENPPSENELHEAKIVYQQKLLLDCFDFQSLRSRFNYFVRLLLGNAGLVQVSGVSDMGGLREMSEKDIFSVGEKFTRQLQSLFTKDTLPESDAHILDRIGKASNWFQGKFAVIFDDVVEKFRMETDNQELRKQIGNTLNYLKQEIVVKIAGIKSCEKGFSPSHYLRSLSNAEIDFSPEKVKKPQAPDYGESDIEHPVLFQRLKVWRSQKAEEQGVPPFHILHQRVLIQISVHLPDNRSALKKIKGVGKKTIEKYGEDLLEMVSAYRKEHGIERVTLPAVKDTTGEKTPSAKSAPVSNTRQISFHMIKQGFTVAGIVKERGLAESTIQGHLCSFIESGELSINRLLSPERQSAIDAVLKKVPENFLSEVKNKLGDDYSYGEIKWMIAHQKYLGGK